MKRPITKLWTRVPGTGLPTYNPEKPLTYIMGSFTCVARYWLTWDNKGHLIPKVRGYTLSGPGMPEVLVPNLGVAKDRVKNRPRG